MVTRRLSLLLLVALTLLVTELLSGCAVTGDADGWADRPTHSALPAVFKVVAPADLRGVCGNYPGLLLHGCAIRDYSVGLCFIYTAANPAPWLMNHELFHCAGWDHVAPRGNVIWR